MNAGPKVAITRVTFPQPPRSRRGPRKSRNQPPKTTPGTPNPKRSGNEKENVLSHHSQNVIRDTQASTEGGVSDAEQQIDMELETAMEELFSE
jgi:hypothetical protein